MKVSELIAELGGYPPDSEAVISIDVIGTTFFHEIRTVVEHEQDDATMSVEIVAGGLTEDSK